MIKRDEKLKKVNHLTEGDIDSLTFCAEELTRMAKSKHITEDSIKRLDSILTQLMSMRSRHSENLLTWLKQGYVAD
jgi:hypothetical protein